MARRKTTEITTEKVDILGKEFRRVVRYDAEHERFIANLPDYVAGTLGGGGYVDGKTQAEMVTNWDRMIKEYAEKIKTERKVIVFLVRSKIEQKEGYRYKDGASNWNYLPTFEGLVSLEFMVLHEFARGEKKDYRDVHGNSVSNHGDLISYHNYSGLHRKAHIIDWTQEREDFFRNMLDALARVKAKLDAFFPEEDTAAIALNIDKSNGNLLGFSGGDK